MCNFDKRKKIVLKCFSEPAAEEANRVRYWKLLNLDNILLFATNQLSYEVDIYILRCCPIMEEGSCMLNDVFMKILFALEYGEYVVKY